MPPPGTRPSLTVPFGPLGHQSNFGKQGRQTPGLTIPAGLVLSKKSGMTLDNHNGVC